jgi:biotin transporter BioY
MTKIIIGIFAGFIIGFLIAAFFCGVKRVNEDSQEIVPEIEAPRR